MFSSSERTVTGGIISSGPGSLTGENTADGKMYAAGNTGGSVTITVTVTDDIDAVPDDGWEYAGDPNISEGEAGYFMVYCRYGRYYIF